MRPSTQASADPGAPVPDGPLDRGARRRPAARLQSGILRTAWRPRPPATRADSSIHHEHALEREETLGFTPRRATGPTPSPDGALFPHHGMAQLFGSIIPKNTATGYLRLTPGDWAELAKVIEGGFHAVLHFSESNGPGVFLNQPFDYPCYLFGVQVLDDTDPNEIVEAFSPLLERMLTRNTHPYFHDRIARA